jgi:echinoid protein
MTNFTSVFQVGKAELQLDVLFGPEVTLPAQKEFAEGEEVILECQVSANPRPHAIIWTKEDDPDFRQAGSTLRLPGSSPAAAVNGRYTCSATNVIQPTGGQRTERHGNASISIAVRHAPGAAFITPERPVALDGKAVTLECGARPPGFPLPTYRWWRGDGQNNAAPPPNTAVLATGSTYTIDSVRLASSGQYYCQPTNELGSGTVAETLLQVYQEPRISSMLQPTMTKRSGDTGFSVICSAQGKPKPRVAWFKDGVQIDEATSNLYQISVTEQEVRSSEAAFNVLTTLKFVGPDRISKDHLMATDRGQYSCQFENEVGRAESNLLLRIEHSPVVRHLHNKVAADAGETARIACRMQAFPGPRFEWSRGNSLLTPRPPYAINVTELNEDIYESILEISHVDEGSYDEYACKASNQLGAQKTLITLQRKGKPEKPKEVRAVDKGSDYVLLEWDEGFDGGYNTTTFNVEYKEIGEGGSAKYADCRWRNPCNLTGLAQHTRYQFKVKAVNIRGDSDWSRDISVTTPVDVARIPTPVHIFYETTSRSVSFNVVNYALVGLVAKIELENPDGTWRPHAQLGMDDLTYGEMPISDPDVIGLRIRLCVNAVEGGGGGGGGEQQQQQQQPLCGDYGTAEIVAVRAASGIYGGSGGGLPLGGIIAIAVFASLLALATLALAVKCCCCNNGLSGRSGAGGKKPKKISKDDITAPKGGLHHNNGGGGYNGGGINTIGGGYGGMDNKGVSAKDLADSPDIIKSQLYGYNYGAAMPAAQVAAVGGTAAAACDQSSSNSNNGGSVNSQVSLRFFLLFWSFDS